MGSLTARDIVAKLEELSEVRAAADVTRIDYEAKREEILKAVKTELDALAAEYEPLLASANERAAALEAEVRRDVVDHGASIKASRLHAVFSRGRITWDNKGLDNFAIAHPEVLRFRKEGEPGVSLRVVK